MTVSAGDSEEAEAPSQKSVRPRLQLQELWPRKGRLRSGAPASEEAATSLRRGLQDWPNSRKSSLLVPLDGGWRRDTTRAVFARNRRKAQLEEGGEGERLRCGSRGDRGH